MKTLLCMMLIAVMLTPDAKAMFGHTAAEKESRLETEQQLAQQEQINGQLVHSNEHLHVLISILCAGVTVALVTGAAIGSKTRQDHGANS